MAWRRFKLAGRQCRRRVQAAQDGAVRGGAWNGGCGRRGRRARIFGWPAICGWLRVCREPAAVWPDSHAGPSLEAGGRLHPCGAVGSAGFGPRCGGEPVREQRRPMMVRLKAVEDLCGGGAGQWQTGDVMMCGLLFCLKYCLRTEKKFRQVAGRTSSRSQHKFGC